MKKNKSEIASELKDAFNEVDNYCSDLDNENYYRSVESKWSIAENIHHLILSTAPLSKAMFYPKLLIRLVAGKSRGVSREYEEVTQAYQDKLDKGGVATGNYVPKGSNKYTPEKSLKKLQEEGLKLISSLDKWSESQSRIFFHNPIHF